MSNDYVTITREQLKTLLVLARVANDTWQRASDAWIEYDESDFRSHVTSVDVENVGQTGDISSETYVAQTLMKLDILRDIDYVASLR